MIEPPPWPAMALAPCFTQRNEPTRLRSMVARTAAASASSIGPMWNEPPAQAKRMSSRPVGLAAAATAAATSSSTVTSATDVLDARPLDLRGDALGRGLELGTGAAADGDGSPVGGQPLGGCETDAAAPAGHEGAPPLQTRRLTGPALRPGPRG